MCPPCSTDPRTVRGGHGRRDADAQGARPPGMSAKLQLSRCARKSAQGPKVSILGHSFSRSEGDLGSVAGVLAYVPASPSGGMADARDSKSRAGNGVWVRLPPRAFPTCIYPRSRVPRGLRARTAAAPPPHATTTARHLRWVPNGETDTIRRPSSRHAASILLTSSLESHLREAIRLMSWCSQCLADHEGSCLDARRQVEVTEALEAWLRAQPVVHGGGWTSTTNGDGEPARRARTRRGG